MASLDLISPESYRSALALLDAKSEKYANVIDRIKCTIADTKDKINEYRAIRERIIQILATRKMAVEDRKYMENSIGVVSDAMRELYGNAMALKAVLADFPKPRPKTKKEKRILNSSNS